MLCDTMRHANKADYASPLPLPLPLPRRFLPPLAMKEAARQRQRVPGKPVLTLIGHSQTGPSSTPVISVSVLNDIRIKSLPLNQFDLHRTFTGRAVKRTGHRPPKLPQSSPSPCPWRSCQWICWPGLPAACDQSQVVLKLMGCKHVAKRETLCEGSLDRSIPESIPKTMHAMWP